MAKNERIDLSLMANKWPSGIVARLSIGEFTGGLIKPKTMANLDCMGKGPKRAYTFSTQSVAYEVSDLIYWLEQRFRCREAR